MQNVTMSRLPCPRGCFLGCALLWVAASAAPVLAQEGGKAGAYKYTDEKGVVHYGDRIPPEYAKRERTILSRDGVEVRRMAAERTPEQLAQDNALAETARKQRAHDNFLLSTYTSVRDIEMLRDRRLEQIADQRRSVESYIATLNERLDALQVRAQVFRPYNEAAGARRMPDQLAEDLIRTMNEVRQQQNSVKERLTEERNLSGQFQADIQRYRALRGGGHANAAVGPATTATTAR